jgi:hypothetical protein
MKTTKLFNSLSKKILEPTKLKPGQRATYRLVNIAPAPMDPSRMAIPTYKNVPPIDQIWDKEKDEYVDIAAVKSSDAEGNHTFHEILFTRANAGHLILVGGRAIDQEIHSYLSICNYNGSNPNRDTSKEIIFEEVNEEAKAEVEQKKRNLRREALNAAADLGQDEVKNFAAALGKDDSRPVAVLRNELEELADKDPQAFLDLIGNKQAVMKATINRSLSKGIIIFNEEQSRWEWPNKEAILTVARGTEAVEELVSFCVSSAKGEKVYQTIQSKAKKPA